MESSNLPFASLSLSASFYGTADLEEPEFVTPDSKYECTACRKYLREPLQTTCGHRICRSCFEEELQRSGPDGFPCLAKEEECEVINQTKVNPDFSAMREMGLLQVYCLNRKYGCPEKLQLKKLKDHLPLCQYVAVSCPFAEFGCQETMAKDAIDNHLSVCNFRPEKCEHCGLLFPFLEIPQHVENDCSQAIVPCPFNCDAGDLRRSQVEDHKMVCPLRPKECRFRALGCNYQGTEAEVQNHEANAAKEHLEIAMLHIMELEVENSRLSGSLQKILTESDTLKSKVTELSRDFEKLRQDQQTFSSLMKQSEQGQLKMLAGHSEKVLKLEDRMKGLEVQGRELAVIQERLVQQERRVQTIGGAESGAMLPVGVQEQFANHDRTIGVHDIRLAELSLRLQCMETTNYDGVLIWKICEYRRRRREATTGNTLSLYSQPFYTSRYGYKMCARVYLNGDGAGKGSHVSFFFVVMQGDYDDILRWPFQQKVTLMLLDQRTNRRHVSDTFRPDPLSSSFTKPTSPMNVASGCPLFVAHSVLEGDETYLKNDTLFFKVVVDTSDLLNP